MSCLQDQVFYVMESMKKRAIKICEDKFKPSCLKSRISKAPMMKKTNVVGMFDHGGESYVRFVKYGPLYRLIPTTASLDINGNLKEPQFELRAVSSDCCESVLVNRPEPVLVTALPSEYFAIGTIPVANEPSVVLGVGFRDHNGKTFHTAEHILNACSGGLRIFKRFGGKYVDIIDNVTFKRGSESNPNIKGTGWDHTAFFFKEESELIKTCADLGIGKAKRFNKKSSGFFEMYGATDEGFWKTRGSLLHQSSASKILGVVQHNASTFGGFSGALMRTPGTGEGISMHICGFKTFNCAITVPALLSHDAPVSSMQDILNSVNESTVYSEVQDGFELEMAWSNRALYEEAQADLAEQLARAYDEQIIEYGIQGSSKAPDPNVFRARWADMVDDDWDLDDWPRQEAALLKLEAKLKEKLATGYNAAQKAKLADECTTPQAVVPSTTCASTMQVRVVSFSDPVIEPVAPLTLDERVSVQLLRDECTRDVKAPDEFKNEAAVAKDILRADDNLIACCMAGAALQDESERFWANYNGDVPPKAPPMRFDGESVDNDRFKELVCDVLKGGAKAARAQLVMNRCFPDATSGKERVQRLMDLDFVQSEVGPYLAATAFTKSWKQCQTPPVIDGTDAVFRDKNGESFFREIGHYKTSIPKNAKKAQDSCFDELWREKMKEGGFGDLADDTIPANTKQNILDSMQAQSARQCRTAPKMSKAALAAFMKCKDTYTCTTPPLYSEERTSHDLPAGWERVLKNLQDKSSGWSNRYRPASKSAWAEKHSAELRKLAAIRLLLRSAAGASMAVMTPLEMVELFLADPKEIFLKGESHSGAKRRGKRWRMIWVSSVIDAVCQSLISLNQNKRDIYDYQAGAKTVHGSGVGHHDDGIKLLMQQISSFAGDVPIKSSDASGWDLSVARLALLLDGERRSQCVPLLNSTIFEADQDDRDIYLAASLSFYTDAFANSAHALNFKGVVFVCDKYGITATGTPNTTSQNSFMRSFILFVAGALWVLSVGDDENHVGDVDEEVLAEWGVITKDGSEGEGFANDFAMLSHDYKKDACGRCYAEYTNVKKMISTNALKLARGEPISPQVVGGQLYVLRDSLVATETYKTAAKVCGWKIDVDEELIRYDEELISQL